MKSTEQKMQERLSFIEASIAKTRETLKEIDEMLAESSAQKAEVERMLEEMREDDRRLKEDDRQLQEAELENSTIAKEQAEFDKLLNDMSRPIGRRRHRKN